MPAACFVIVRPSAQTGGPARGGEHPISAGVVQKPKLLGDAVTRQQEQMILRLWRDWCRLWPEQFGHESLQVKPQGYDPVFDVIPSQTYKDFYLEVVRGHPSLKTLNVFEVIDVTLNQVRAPETSGVGAPAKPAAARVAEVDLPANSPSESDLPDSADRADSA